MRMEPHRNSSKIVRHNKSSITHLIGQIDIEYNDEKIYLTIVTKTTMYMYVLDVTVNKTVKTVGNLSHILHPLSSSVTNNSNSTTMRNKQLFYLQSTIRP